VDIKKEKIKTSIDGVLRNANKKKQNRTDQSKKKSISELD